MPQLIFKSLDLLQKSQVSRSPIFQDIHLLCSVQLLLFLLVFSFGLFAGSRRPLYKCFRFLQASRPILSNQAKEHLSLTVKCPRSSSRTPLIFFKSSMYSASSRDRASFHCCWPLVLFSEKVVRSLFFSPSSLSLPACCIFRTTGGFRWAKDISCSLIELLVLWYSCFNPALAFL